MSEHLHLRRSVAPNERPSKYHISFIPSCSSRLPLTVRATRAAFYGLSVFISFFLMLVFMTYNVRRHSPYPYQIHIGFNTVVISGISHWRHHRRCYGGPLHLQPGDGPRGCFVGRWRRQGHGLSLRFARTVEFSLYATCASDLCRFSRLNANICGQIFRFFAFTGRS